jgi:hypothetical protein
VPQQLLKAQTFQIRPAVAAADSADINSCNVVRRGWPSTIDHSVIPPTGVVSGSIIGVLHIRLAPSGGVVAWGRGAARVPWLPPHRRRTPMAAFQTLLGLGTLHPPTTYEQITTRPA